MLTTVLNTVREKLKENKRLQDILTKLIKLLNTLQTKIKNSKRLNVAVKKVKGNKHFIALETKLNANPAFQTVRAKLRENKPLAIVTAIFVSFVIFRFTERVYINIALWIEAWEDSITPVAVVKPQAAPTTETITLPGNIEAWYQATIFARVPGYVKMWYKDYGARVKKGDLLAELDTPTLTQSFEQSKADMAAILARKDLASLTAKRYTAMRSAHAVSEQMISVKQANSRAEQAQYEAAEHLVGNFEAQLKFKMIVAPYDGVVISRHINVGDYVTPEGGVSSGDQESKTNLFTVADIHKMRLFVSVPERLGGFLQVGLKADVVLPQYPNRHYSAEFFTVAGGFDPETRTAVTEFYIDNQDESVWPGSYARVTISAPVNSNMLVIPATALVFQEQGAQVAVVTPENKVHFKDIKVDKLLNDVIQINDGITKDDQIINQPSAALLEGDKVRVVEPARGYRSHSE